MDGYSEADGYMVIARFGKSEVFITSHHITMYEAETEARHVREQLSA